MNLACAVSVIIPIYNAEKYFGVCLESLLIQTLSDFEVIVVDDCSTDNSLAIADSYLERFGGRLKLITLPTNTGSGAVPRNVGLEHASGKYIFFADADDLLIDEALETLYNYAEEYQADIVYMEKGFQCGAEIIPQNLDEVFWNPPRFANEKISFETADTSERVNRFINLAFGLASWSKFLRRNFLITNRITFPHVKISEDVLWTFKIICLAERILRIPTPLYVYRLINNSISRVRRTPEDEIKFWLDPILKSLSCLDEFMSKLNFFKQNSEYRFQVLKFFELWNTKRMFEALKSFEPHELYKIFLREVTKMESTQPALIAYLFVMMNLYRSELNK